MKTSSKILIGLLSTIFLIMSAMFIEVRLFGLHGDERFTKTFTTDFPLESFSHVVIENSGSINISQGDKNKIEFVAYNDTAQSTIQYKMSGDTLKISRSHSPQFSNYTLYTSSAIASISVKDSDIRLTGINQDSMNIYMENGQISSYGNPEERSCLKSLKIIQANSRLQFDNMKIDALDIEMEKSNARFGQEIAHVNASILSESELSMKEVEKLELKKDKSSQIHFW